MKNILAPRCLYWSALQMVVFAVCYKGIVSCAEIVQGCVGSQLMLKCPEMKVISVTAVVLGDSVCWTKCCIAVNGCTGNANERHTSEVHHRCNGQRRCNVQVVHEEISCNYWLSSSATSDFERIIYNCRDEPQNDTTNSTEEHVYSNGNGFKPSDNDYEKPQEDEQSDNSFVAYAVMVTICIVVLVAIIVVVVMMRRKKLKQVTDAVEMTDIHNNDRSETIYANENQNPSLSHKNGSAASKTKKSNKGATASEAHEMPGNAVYNLAGDAGSTQTEDPNLYCDVDSKELPCEVPRFRSDVYSVVRDFKDPGRAGSTANISGADDIVYSDVETREPAGEIYDEACNVNESEYKVVTTDKAKPGQKKASPSHTKAPDTYSKVNKPSKSAAVTSDLKAAFPGKAEANGAANTSDGFPSPTYETMSPGIIPEGIYANQPALSPTRSLVASITSSGGSETENPYCDMQSPPIKFKEDGSQTLIENDLYSQ